MKVGTDGCLLGAWADIASCKRVLDVGCGSGLISIMIAQRSNAFITGVEIDTDAAQQAAENVSRTHWSERIRIVNSDILAHSPIELYDAIVSNPPFFCNSLKNKETKRTIARHNDTLSCSSLLQYAKNTLVPKGTLSVVIPYEQMNEWCDEGLFKGLSTKRITVVRTLPYKPIKRVMLEFINAAYPAPEIKELTIENKPGEYSDDFKDIFRDFYLKIE